MNSAQVGRRGGRMRGPATAAAVESPYSRVRGRWKKTELTCLETMCSFAPYAFKPARAWRCDCAPACAEPLPAGPVGSPHFVAGTRNSVGSTGGSGTLLVYTAVSPLPAPSCLDTLSPVQTAVVYLAGTHLSVHRPDIIHSNQLHALTISCFFLRPHCLRHSHLPTDIYLNFLPSHANSTKLS